MTSPPTGPSTEPSADAPVVAPRRRWMRWALIASLALNLLVVGAVVGSFVRGGGPWGQGGRGAPGNIIGYVMSLPAERRGELLKRSSALRTEMRMLRQQVRAANRERIAAFTAEPFDRQRYVDAQTRQIETDRQIRLLTRDVAADTASGMTADERRAFLRWRSPPRGPGGDDSETDGPPPKKL